MGNTLLTPQEIAREALVRLKSNMVMAGLVHTDYSAEFQKKGDTVTIRKPATFVADEFGGTINLQEIGEDSVAVKLDKIADVSVEVTSKELTLDVQDFGAQILDGAVLAIAEKIDNDLASLYKYVPYFSGTPGSTPSALTDISAAMKVLNANRVPMGMRSAVWDPEAHASLVTLDALAGLDKSGTTAALREASMGRVMMFDNFMDQNIKTHVAGGYTALEDVTATVNVANNASDSITGLTYSVAALTSAAETATTKLVKGDILTIGGKQYTVIEDTATAVAGVISIVKVFPALEANVTDATVTFPDKTAGGHTANLGFHKNAFALVSRPLVAPMGGADSYVTNLSNDINIRVTMGYDMTTKKNIISIDCLYGVAPIFSQLATRILG
ncbi:P22 coat protein [Crassaminicella thermophila]|uniref:P22 coat protein n=1 Tax=Crassaminicella thermophila TaxID=2599308 RepID=A0A5C0SEK6_CRATE|nr:P22 phage major capsid protein family protein [Crassaminicella thermophila]QEK11688.1 P22 coat protein [Crassaminicella thermophila]